MWLEYYHQSPLGIGLTGKCQKRLYLRRVMSVILKNGESGLVEQKCLSPSDTWIVAQALPAQLGAYELGRSQSHRSIGRIEEASRIYGGLQSLPLGISASQLNHCAALSLLHRPVRKIPALPNGVNPHTLPSASLRDAQEIEIALGQENGLAGARAEPTKCGLYSLGILVIIRVIPIKIYQRRYGRRKAVYCSIALIHFCRQTADTRVARGHRSIGK